MLAAPAVWRGLFLVRCASPLFAALAAGNRFCMLGWRGYNGRMMRNPLLYGLLLLSLFASAAGMQDLRQLEQVATAFAEAEAGSDGFRYQVGKADPRLRLPACAQPPTAGWPGGQKPPFTALELACAAQGWRILLPVTASQLSVGYVTTRQLRAGEVLQAGDIKLMPVSNRALALQAVRDPALIVGKALRSTLPAGSLLRESQLRLPLVIKTNQPVRVLVQGSGFVIGSDAVALGNAAVGERLNVRVPSGKVISGVVQEDLSVLIAAP